MLIERPTAMPIGSESRHQIATTPVTIPITTDSFRRLDGSGRCLKGGRGSGCIGKRSEWLEADYAI
jgi:hypothetical protein